ncbi:MAG: hypothetical protein GY866_02840 [Proteobacteria bacterium]|nr:hypothetical protein [Pseudomonadota bacterium]
MTKSPLVNEGWTGENKRDTIIEPLKAADDRLHTEIGTKRAHEWWYFDAHLDDGHTIVVFFHASNPNPGIAGQAGVELVLVRPDGQRTQQFIKYPKSDFKASREKADVTVGKNYLKVDHPDGSLPVYEIHIDEKDLGFHLVYQAQVNGWKPGTGTSTFGDLGHFSWVVPMPRASVEGTFRDGEKTVQCRGIGYHDHNWLDFQFAKIIEYWMWGRIYSESYTISYAFIQCNRKMENYAVKVLMLAEGREVILSSGDFDFTKEDFEYNDLAKHTYPKKITIKTPTELEAVLSVRKVLEAEDMLNNFNPVLRFVAKNILRLKPGYFRLISDFEIQVNHNGKSNKESGTTLHEIVMFKPAKQ